MGERIYTYTKYLESVSDNIVAYHGTPNGYFKEFSMDKRATGADKKGSGVGDYGKGFYFTPYKEYALSYATKERSTETDSYLYTVHLKMDNPFNMKLYNDVRREISELIKKHGIFNVPDTERNKVYKRFGTTEDQYDFFIDIEDSMNDNWGDWDIPNKLINKGYDSIINHNGYEYIVFDANQIRIINTEKV